MYESPETIALRADPNDPNRLERDRREATRQAWLDESAADQERRAAEWEESNRRGRQRREDAERQEQAGRTARQAAHQAVLERHRLAESWVAEAESEVAEAASPPADLDAAARALSRLRAAEYMRDKLAREL